MTVSVTDKVVELVGAVTVEDAEPLTAWLREHPRGRVGLRRCTSLHTAALQALLASGARVVGTPADPFLATHVLPLLRPSPEPSVVDPTAPPDPTEATP